MCLSPICHKSARLNKSFGRAIPYKLNLVYTRLRMDTTLVAIFGVLFLLVVIAIVLLVRIEMRLKKLFRGSKAENLEGLMRDLSNHAKMVDDGLIDHSNKIDALRLKLDKQGRGIKLTRFNPFTDVGGNQSFAVSIINSEGDGVVFSSLYSRDRMSVFAKPIKGGTSDIELSPEEKSVVEEVSIEMKK